MNAQKIENLPEIKSFEEHVALRSLANIVSCLRFRLVKILCLAQSNSLHYFRLWGRFIVSFLSFIYCLCASYTFFFLLLFSIFLAKCTL